MGHSLNLLVKAVKRHLQIIENTKMNRAVALLLIGSAVFSLANARACRSTEFSCANGKCIPQAFINDGDNDCGDRSDEGASCNSNQFVCADSGCITRAFRCDNDNDCKDGSDERSCAGFRQDPTAFLDMLTELNHLNMYLAEITSGYKSASYKVKGRKMKLLQQN